MKLTVPQANTLRLVRSGTVNRSKGKWAGATSAQSRQLNAAVRDHLVRDTHEDRPAELTEEGVAALNAYEDSVGTHAGQLVALATYAVAPFLRHWSIEDNGAGPLLARCDGTMIAIIGMPFGHGEVLCWRIRMMEPVSPPTPLGLTIDASPYDVARALESL